LSFFYLKILTLTQPDKLKFMTMKLKSILFFLFMSIIFSQCKKEAREIRFSKFPVEYNLKAIVFENQNINFTPSFICLIDSLIILKNPKATDKVYHIYNKKDFNYITSFCRIGHGEGEFISPANIAFNHKTRSIWVLDYGNTKFWEFPLDSILTNYNYLPERFIQLPMSLMPIGGMEWIKDTILAITGTTGDALLYLYNEKGKFIGEYGKKVIKREKSWRDISYAMVSDFRFMYNEKRDELVAVHKHYDLISFYKNGKHKLSVRGPIFLKPKFEFIGDVIKYGNTDTYTAYYCPYQYKNYILVDFVGKGHTYMNGRLFPLDYPKHIFVFDWEGNVIARLNTDRELGFYCIDENEKMIYAIDIASENPIIKYDLSEIKELQ